MATASISATSLSSSFCGSCKDVGAVGSVSNVKVLGASFNGSRVFAASSLKSAKPKVTKAAKKVVKNVKSSAVKVAKKASSSDRPLWFPGAKAPFWLDGSLTGDYGFDPLGLGKPPEYLQFELDSLNQNLAKNKFGDVIGSRIDKKSDLNATPFQPYSEVFGLQRFRECELIHGRWAMLAIVGALSVEAFTGVTWQDAGEFELVNGASYFGLPLPFSTTGLVWIEALIIGYIEFQRNAELDPEKRLYPGGKFFDPLGLASDPDAKAVLKIAELKHARLAMVAAFGFAVQAAATGKGPLENWGAHLLDPLHTTIIDTFSK